MRWSNCTVSVFSKKLRHSGMSKNSRDDVRHQSAVDQRPGVVDVAGAQAGDQRAEIDLRKHQNKQTDGAQRECAPGAGAESWSSSRCAVHRIAM